MRTTVPGGPITRRWRTPRADRVGLAQPLDRIPLGLQPAEELVAVLLVPHREGELDLRAGDREVHALAMVVDAEHVRAPLGDERDQAGEVAGPVVHPRADHDVAARTGEAVAQHLDEGARVDVAAREERARRPLPLDPARKERGERGGAGTLDRELAALADEQDRAGLLHGDPVRDRRARGLRAGEGRAGGGLDADDAEAGPHLLEGQRDAGREAAAADRDDERLDLRPELLGELEPERALAGDHAPVLE